MIASVDTDIFKTLTDSALLKQIGCQLIMIT